MQCYVELFLGKQFIHSEVPLDSDTHKLHALNEMYTRKQDNISSGSAKFGQEFER
jgi:hypothetical protein